MIQKLCKKNLFLAVIIGLAVLLYNTCGEAGKILEVLPATYDTIVCFRVNFEGNGFENVGTGGDEFTAIAVGGRFTKDASGLYVFDTGGKAEGTWRIPWMNANWIRYVEMGYVELNEKVGELLAASENWTIETIFALPLSHQHDIVDQYIWFFSDSFPFPPNMFGVSWREMFMRIISPSTGLINVAPPGKDAAGDPDYFSPLVDNYRQASKGYWTHLVVTKTEDGLVTIYINGEQSGREEVVFPEFLEGTFVNNFLARTPYPDGGPDGANNVFGYTLYNTGYYHFAIDVKAWDASEVSRRYENSLVGRGTLVFW
jgi:hypothetical protein